MSEMKNKISREIEILTATKKLINEGYYYKDINIKKIGTVTSFSRPSIYNYFETKEEIFLSLLTNEYLAWADELFSLNDYSSTFSQKQYINQLAQSLDDRPLMLKLLSNNLTDFEEKSRIEVIVKFKASYGRTMDAVDSNIQVYFPEMSKEDRMLFRYTFFPSLFGLNPYSIGTPKQQEGLHLAGVDFTYFSVYELTRNLLMKILPLQNK